MIDFRDEFLSEEDLDLKTLTEEELDAVWTAWLQLAQATNEQDRKLYSHSDMLEIQAFCGRSLNSDVTVHGGLSQFSRRRRYGL